MTAVRAPTLSEYRAYDGAHCFRLWRALSESWRCPGCQRSRYEILRWTRRYFPHPHYGWMAGLHRHHDHSIGHAGGDGRGRFAEVVVCDQCNAADGAAKRNLGLPSQFSFSPLEIGQFVQPEVHGRHRLNLRIAQALYEMHAERTVEGAS